MISKEGFGIIAVLALFVAMFAFLGMRQGNKAMNVLAVATFVMFVFTLYFFRDPKRVPPIDELAIVSPADGRVVEIAQVQEPEFIEGEATRIAIFLSLFNVHVNYIPCDGTVEYVKYNRGRHHRADTDDASEENVHTLIGLETKFGKIAFKQMVGMLARRIVCNLRYGDQVKKGEKFGIIKFGSRMEIYLPAGAKVQVKEGDRLVGGESIIASANEK